MRTTMSAFALASCQIHPLPRSLVVPVSQVLFVSIGGYQPLDLRLPSLKWIASINVERCVAALLATLRWGTVREKTTVSFGSEI